MHPRYVLPDYAKALRQGSRHLELDPPVDLDDALSFLTILYGHVPSVTTYPVYLGDLDALLEPFVPADLPDAELDRKLRRFWIQLDRLLPDAFVHTNLGPGDGRVVRSILRVERSLRQVVPNITLKVDPAVTPDSLIEDAVQHRLRHRQTALRQPPDDGRRPRRPVCRGQLLQLAQDRWRLAHPRAAQPQGVPRSARTAGWPSSSPTGLPMWVELTAELIEARIRSLVEHQHFFETHWLAQEGLIDIERFSAMFGIFGLAECVAELLAHDGIHGVRYGHDAVANDAAYRIVERVAELVAARPLPYCAGGAGAAYLHSQSGIDLDVDVTAGTASRSATSRGCASTSRCARRTTSTSPRGQRHLPRRPDRGRNPSAMVDIIRGAFTVGMRDFTFNLDDNEFIRITGYLVRKSDLVGIDEHGARHGSDYLAAGAEATFHLTERAVKRIRAHELDPRPRG
jgi:hypothetical protein